MKNIELLLENKAKNDKAIADYADSLRETLRLLDGAITPPKGKEVKKQWTGIVRRLPSISSLLIPHSSIVRGLMLILFGVTIGAWGQIPFSIMPDKPPIVRPETESLEDFAAREAERLLTADERVKLIAVAEMILGQHFTRPSAIEEEFRFQRRLAGIDSPAFNAFVDKWAAKVEEMQFEDSVESMREIYRSLVRGLQEVKATVDGSDEPVEVFEQSFPSNVPAEKATEEVPDSSELVPTPPPPEVEAKPPPIEEQKQTIQRQRTFRR